MNRYSALVSKVAILSLAVATGQSMQFAHAAIIPVISGITTDGTNTPSTGNVVTGVAVSGKTFPSLVAPNTAVIQGSSPNTSGIALLTGMGNTFLTLNFFTIGNNYGYVDLTNFGGNTLVTSRDNNAALQDFLLVDHIGNDNFGIAAILPDGTLGQRRNIQSSSFGQQAGVQIFNDQITAVPAGLLAFDITDLFDAGGSPLTPGSAIRGLRVFENQTDPPTGTGGGLDLVVLIGDVVPVIPEPSTAILAGLALVWLSAVRRK